MPALAVLTGPLPKAGVVFVAVLAAAALLAQDPRARARAIGGVVILAPILLVAEIWNSPQLTFVHRHPLFALVGAALALGLVIALAVVMGRYPRVLPLLSVAALPFRVPVSTPIGTVNLLVPLYLVVAAGAIAMILQALRTPAAKPTRDPTVRENTLVPRTARARATRPAQLGTARAAKPAAACWVERLLALYIVLYAVQAIYSPSFQTALQNMVFFYVPFALLYVLLSHLQWTPALLRLCFLVTVCLALAFAVIGFVEYATKTIFLNEKLVIANDLHTYFIVNSVFFDPNIFGRFLVLVMIGLATTLLFEHRPREQLSALASLAVLWAGLLLTISRSSQLALLLGLSVVAALRWQLQRAVIIAGTVLAVGAVVIAISPTTFGLNQGLNGASSGRDNLVTRGLHLFSERPLWGYGSGSFEHEYQARYHGNAQTVSASHTIAVTIAAEQGLIGELAYLALIIAAIIRLLRGARSDPARVAFAAAFIALIFHTLLYADFLEDPFTWALLAVGSALAHASATRPRPRARTRPSAQTSAAAA